MLTKNIASNVYTSVMGLALILVRYLFFKYVNYVFVTKIVSFIGYFNDNVLKLTIYIYEYALILQSGLSI